MNRPVLYSNANHMQRQTIYKLLQDYMNQIKFRPDGKDSLLDVGCGTGDILIEYIRPILPETYQKIVGTDVSRKMIEYSRRRYGELSRVDFKIYNITSKILPVCYKEQFDHVTSFFCLHWAINQKQALENIYKMLRNNGDCFLIFFASHPIFKAYRTLSLDPRWSEYMYDVDEFICPSQEISEPLPVFEKLFEEAGFQYKNLDIREEIFCYEDHKSFEDHLISVTGFLERMTLEEQQEFITDMCRCWRDMNLSEHIPDTDGCRFYTPNKLVVAYARK